MFQSKSLLLVLLLGKKNIYVGVDQTFVHNNLVGGFKFLDMKFDIVTVENINLSET